MESRRVLVLQDIVKDLSVETGTSEALCQSFVKELFAVVADGLADEGDVALSGVGRFFADGGEVRFDTDPDLAAAVNSAFDCFEAMELADEFDGSEPEETEIVEEDTNGEDHSETADDDADETPYAVDSSAGNEEPVDEETPEDNEEETPIAEDEETKIEEVTEEPESTDEEPVRHRSGRFAWGFLSGFMTAAVIAAAAWLFTTTHKQVPAVAASAVTAESTASAAVQESTAMVIGEQSQMVEQEKPSVEETKPREQTFTVTNTAYLSNISRKFYGHYAFWVYIYLENKDVIKDPDNLPVGAELRIPSPEKYGIDKDDPESIRRAEIKALEVKSGK